MPEPLENLRAVCREHAPKPKPELHNSALPSYVGKYVKIAFPDLEDAQKIEHMWVHVEAVHENLLRGTLNNSPVLNVGVSNGSPVVFSVEEIEEVFDGD